jgi:hypothetical protein
MKGPGPQQRHAGHERQPDLPLDRRQRLGDPAKVFWKQFVGTGQVASLPSFVPGSPSFQSVSMPTTNQELRAQAARGNGCLFTGPTRIVFNTGPPGTMTVTSPYTTRSTFDCGTFSAPSFTATIPVPQDRVIYVEDGPTDCQTRLPTWRSVIGFPIAGDTSMDGVTSQLGYRCTQGDVFVEGPCAGR